MAKANAIVLTEAQMGFVQGATKAVSALLSAEAKGKADVKALKESVAKALTAHKTEINLNLKGLKLSGFKWTGNAATNPVAKAFYEAFIASGQVESTARNSVSAVKMSYTGDIGASTKYHNGLEVRTFELNAIKKGTKFYGLLDGKPVTVDRGDVSCANALIKAMGQEGFEAVARAFIKELGADPRKVTAEEITVSFQNALTATKLAILKDGKVVPK